MKKSEAGYTKNVVSNHYFDLVEELSEFIKDKNNIGTPKHYELSKRLSTFSDLQCA